MSEPKLNWLPIQNVWRESNKKKNNSSFESRSWRCMGNVGQGVDDLRGRTTLSRSSRWCNYIMENETRTSTRLPAHVSHPSPPQPHTRHPHHNTRGLPPPSSHTSYQGFSVFIFHFFPRDTFFSFFGLFLRFSWLDILSYSLRLSFIFLCMF